MSDVYSTPEYIRKASIACQNWAQQTLDFAEPQPIALIPTKIEADRTPDDMTISERRLYNLNPADHEWRRQYFGDLPDYLARYFADRYIRIFEAEGRAAANIFLRTYMGEDLQHRISMVRQRYRHLPTIQKIAVMNDDVDQSNFKHQHAVEKGTLEQLMKKPAKNRRERILAELSKDEVGNLAAQVAVLFEKCLRDLSEAVNPKVKYEVTIVQAYEHLAEMCRSFGIVPPVTKQTILPEDAECGIGKLSKENWWKNKLWRARNIMREHLAIAMGGVSKLATPYCSRDCLEEHKAQCKRNWDMISNHELFDEDTEETAQLEDMVLKSVANPAIRRHELMTRVRGCEDLAANLQLAGQFYTLTAPSKYHNSRKRRKKGARNTFVEHWNGASPRDTQQYLCRTWAKIRAEMARADIRWFGIRVAEPHHDGTPHWHILLWLKPEDVKAAKAIFIDYAVEEDRGELISKRSGKLLHRARCDVKTIDPDKGTATGYIAKYISKNIDGYAMDDAVSKETGKPVQDMAKNVTAWASRWSIRQFQFFGGAPVTVWRELRRLANLDRNSFAQYLFELNRNELNQLWTDRNHDYVGPHMPAYLMQGKEIRQRLVDSYQPKAKLNDQIAETLQAADEGNWQGYVMGQGGPFAKRKEHPITTHYEVTPFGNEYGEAVSRVKGVDIFNGESSETKITRVRNWTIRKKSATGTTAGEGALVSGGSAASRSSVNNCTGARPDRFVDDLKAVIRKTIGPLADTDNNLSRLLAGQTLFTNDGARYRLRSGPLNRQSGSVPLEIETTFATKPQPYGGWDGWDEPKKQTTPKHKPDTDQPDLLSPASWQSDDDWPLI
ncbi:replication endonuclease [Photobacterium sp. CCB-ST2H9]|uniref:replication endonuclease n=1 Tax=Photobacterium sp. CCB-ST2H9 TaxID=2912855 RepID=UPI0020047B6A|nr:replication endonuclease [Photobacterium sp. CCB-ST2H9]UTM59232.1 replication endonuclease [Photobacterium sp. CCB-ST2H9]